ncbi:MAG: outer membrane beta-barrel protein [Bryobacteraceae bacterium]|nr:outer membrane beta-barrel protein [Bryobacteraceae bacterium]
MAFRPFAGILVLGISLVIPEQLQAQYRFFAGGGPGQAILSNDTGISISGSSGSISTYSQKKGLLLHAFAGWHLFEYFSVQGAWNWNRNDLTFSGVETSGRSFEEMRTSSQQNAGLDAVVYFRKRSSLVRPFLTTGLNVSFLQSDSRVSPRFTATDRGLRVAAGADFLLPRGWGVRYAFNEILQGNPLGRRLTPKGTAPLMNFQHLFGFVKYF